MEPRIIRADGSGEIKPALTIKIKDLEEIEDNETLKKLNKGLVIDSDLHYQSLKIPKKIRKVFQKKTLKKIKMIFKEADLQLLQIEKEMKIAHKKIMSTSRSRKDDVYSKVMAYLKKNIDNIDLKNIQNKVDDISRKEYHDQITKVLEELHLNTYQKVAEHMKKTELKVAGLILDSSKEGKPTVKGLYEILTMMKGLRQTIGLSECNLEGEIKTVKKPREFERMLLHKDLEKFKQKVVKLEDIELKEKRGGMLRLIDLKELEDKGIIPKRRKEIERKENRIEEKENKIQKKENRIEAKENRIEEKENRIEEKENRIEEKKPINEIEILKEKKEIQIKVENNHTGSKNINDFNSLDLRVSILEDTLPAFLLSEYGCFVVGVDENNYLISKYREGLIFYLEGKMVKKYTIGSKYIYFNYF